MLHLPQNPKEWFLFGWFWIGGMWTVVYEIFIVMWHYHHEWNNAVIIHIVITVVFACIIFSDMYFLITTDVTANQVSGTDSSLQVGWKYCEKCQSHSPPRSHHCKICDVCILKRDHHCWFVGYCIGLNNHRYFISLALFTCLAGIYCNIYNWEFVMNELGGFTWTTLPALIAPHVGLFFGRYTLYEFFLTANTSVGLLFTIFFIFLLYTQIVQIVNGQVKYERKMGIQTYNLGLKNSLKEIFGSAGMLMLACPYLPTKLESDGTCFPEREHKDE